MSGSEETLSKAAWTIEALDLAVSPEQLIPVHSRTVQGLDVDGLQEPKTPSGEMESILRKPAEQARKTAALILQHASKFLAAEAPATQALRERLQELDEHLASDAFGGKEGAGAFEQACVSVEQATKAVTTATEDANQAMAKEKERRRQAADKLAQEQQVDLPRDLKEATAYLPPTEPVLKTLTEQLSTLEQLTGAVTKLSDQGSPLEFESATTEVRQHHVKINDAIKLKEEAVALEKERRAAELEKLTKLRTDLAENDKKSIKILAPLLAPESFGEIKKTLFDVQSACEQTSLPTSSWETFDLVTTGLARQLDGLKKQVSELFRTENQRRKSLVAEKTLALEQKVGQYDDLKNAYEEAWSKKPCPHDGAKEELNQKVAEYLSKTLQQKYQRFEKRIAEFATVLTPLDDLYQTIRTEIQNGIDLKKVNDNRRTVQQLQQDVAQRLSKKTGAAQALENAQVSIDRLLEQNKNTEALAELTTLEEQLGELNKIGRAINDASMALKRCQHFKTTAGDLAKALREIDQDDGSDLKRLAERVTALLLLTDKANALHEKFRVVHDKYSIEHAKLRFDAIQERDLGGALTRFRETEDLNDLTTFELLTDKALLELKEFDRIVAPIEQGLKLLEGAPATTRGVVDQLKERFQVVRQGGKMKGFGTATSALVQLTTEVDQTKLFVEEVAALESQLKQVSDFEKLRNTANQQFVADMQEATQKFRQGWQFSQTSQELGAASENISRFAELGSLLEKIAQAYHTATTSGAGKAVGVVKAILEQIKTQASKQEWNAAKELVGTLNVVALAVTKFAKASTTASSKANQLKSSLKESDFAPLVKVVDTFYRTARKAADENTEFTTAPYEAASKELLALLPVYQAVAPVAEVYLAARTQYKQIAGLYPDESVDGPREDLELKSKLADALLIATSNQDPLPDAYNQATKALQQLTKELTEKQQQRRAAAKSQIETAVQGEAGLEKLVAKLFDGETSILAMAEVCKKLKPAEVKSLLQGIDVDPQDKDKSKAAKCIVDLQGAVGGEGIKMLLERLGTPATTGAKPNIGRLLTDDDPQTKLLTEIHGQFQGEPQKLQDLVSDGFGGNPDVLANITLKTCQGSGQKLKALADAFGTDNSELKTLIDVFGPDDCGDKLGAVVTQSYQGDVRKLKTGLYDEVANAFSGTSQREKLWKAAPTFARKDPKKSASDLLDKKGLNLRGCGDVRIEHFLERHTRDFFNFGDNDRGLPNINVSNTQWPTDISKQQLTKILQGAIDQVEPLITRVEGWEDDDYEPRDVTVDGVKVRIGIQKFEGKGKPSVAQFFPLESSPTVKLEQFNQTQMETLANALGS